MADITCRTTSDGQQRWRVRYRTAGRGSPRRTRTFTTQQMAVKFAGLIDLLGWAQAERMLTEPALPLSAP